MSSNASVDDMSCVLSLHHVHLLNSIRLPFADSGVTAGVPEEEARRRSRLRAYREQLVSRRHPHPAWLPLYPGLPSSPVPSADAAPCLPAQLLFLLSTHPANRRGQSTRAPGGSAVKTPGQQRPVVSDTLKSKLIVLQRVRLTGR